MAKKRVVTLLSGGIDSMVMTDVLAKEKNVNQFCLFVDYGQRAAVEENKAAIAFAKGKVRLEKAEIRIRGISIGSQLLSGNKQDKPFMPGRNLLLLAAASLKACELRTDYIAIGVRDVPAFSDTSDVFIHGFSGLSYLAFGRNLTVLTPLLHLSKAEVVKMGRDLRTRLSLAYSCYLGMPRPCARCLGCKDRKGLII
jgi:7-cyano-7-deazaguanine synthase